MPLRWYQRAWVWFLLAIALFGVLLGTFEFLEASWSTFVTVVVALVGIPICMWMSALVARRGWAQFMLTMLTAVVLLLPAWAVWNYNNALEDVAIEGCLIIAVADDGSPIYRDADLCETVEDGRLQSLQRNVWIGAGIVLLGPLVLLYFLRKRFLPADETQLEEAAAG